MELLYLVSILDSIAGTGIVLAIIGTAFSVVGIAMYLVNLEDYNYTYKKAGKILGLSALPVAVVGILISCFVPSTRAGMTILGLQAVKEVSITDADKLPKETISFLRAWLKANTQKLEKEADQD